MLHLLVFTGKTSDTWGVTPTFTLTGLPALSASQQYLLGIDITGTVTFIPSTLGTDVLKAVCYYRVSHHLQQLGDC